MCYVPIPMTERNRNLREVYLKMPVAQEEDPYKDKKYKRFCTGDRWITLGYLRGWLKYSDAPTTRLRNSHAEAEELYQAEPVIPEGELLVGHLYLPEYSPEEREEYEKKLDRLFGDDAGRIRREAEVMAKSKPKNAVSANKKSKSKKK